MLGINENTKIFMVCPPKLKTGGPELAHQLVHELQKLGLNAYIYYIGGDENPVNDEFKKYNDKYIINLDNNDLNNNNILIVPETYTYLVKKYYRKIQTAIWWMSVDNYYRETENKNKMKQVIKKIINYNQPYMFEKKINTNHFCQSRYALEFLKDKGVENNNIYYLSDYINETYLGLKIDYSKKENNVLYNPKKGFEFTKKLIDNSKNINWIPIQNLTTEQVKKLLCKSKVYIDFGNHPGKDRFPREAAACGCCIITGKRGSAKYYEDIPIMDKYKFEDDEENIGLILDKIYDCLENYNLRINDFKNYIECIEKEKDIFENDIKNIFIIRKIVS